MCWPSPPPFPAWLEKRAGELARVRSVAYPTPRGAAHPDAPRRAAGVGGKVPGEFLALVDIHGKGAGCSPAQALAVTQPACLVRNAARRIPAITAANPLKQTEPSRFLCKVESPASPTCGANKSSRSQKALESN